jgi:hypothetical protein
MSAFNEVSKSLIAASIALAGEPLHPLIIEPSADVVEPVPAPLSPLVLVPLMLSISLLAVLLKDGDIRERLALLLEQHCTRG